MPDRLQCRLAEIGAPADVRELAAELAEQAVRDPLTGLYNRRFFDEALTQQVETARRYNRDLSLVIFDLDRFKEVNDTLGHEAGDTVLKTFSRLLVENARKADIVCRIGGDEFAVILPETEVSRVRNFLDRFFQCLENSGIKASAGAAALPAENLLSIADSQLLAAKCKNKSR
ncbi:MAG: GGDEF domain-containing protein [Kiritimatiellales bacterium]|nr:GGDEF domain-containing protein [Kiritimatiellales bacterium]